MAYLCNWFYHPVIKGYFQERGIKVNDEAYALSSMIQWIWRSQSQARVIRSRYSFRLSV